MRPALIALLLAVASCGWAWQWPVPVPRVTRTFGQDAGGYAVRGMELAGGAQPVFPVEAGTVVVSHAERASLPSGLGSFVVVEHAQGFRSVYAHLDAASLPEVGQRVEPATQIGTVGESGQISSRALRLMIIDLESGAYVNPLLLLPDLEDVVPPRIGAVYARNAGSLYDLRLTTELPEGTYEIVGDVTDRMERPAASPRLAPYRLTVFVAGQETLGLEMNRMLVRDGESTFGGDALSPDALFDADGLLRLGELTISAARTEIEIVAEDFAGNQGSWRTTLSVPATEPGDGADEDL